MKAKDAGQHRIRRAGKRNGLVQAEVTTITNAVEPANWAEFRRQANSMLNDLLGSADCEDSAWQAIPDEVRARFHEAFPAEPATLESSTKSE